MSERRKASTPEAPFINRKSHLTTKKAPADQIRIDPTNPKFVLLQYATMDNQNGQRRRALRPVHRLDVSQFDFRIKPEQDIIRLDGVRKHTLSPPWFIANKKSRPHYFIRRRRSIWLFFGGGTHLKIHVIVTDFEPEP
jgi:hypothetical protein